ncbi:MAG: FadR/GntR family transcriptional regulator [Lachnospiraceae bacterium]|nr:FadR/GntR family transcriptional regulator [Lachnospiraceae bacterium]
MTFESIKSTKVNAQVVQQIKDSIYQGELKKGDKLPTVNELHEAWGVSRSSIREAFSALELVGIIKTRTSEGTFIANEDSTRFLEPLSLMLVLEEDIAKELLEFRMLLERDCIRLAVGKIMPEELEKMRKCIEILEESKGDEKSDIEADRMFHYTIARASGNKVIYQVLTSIYEAMDLHIKKICKKLSLDADSIFKLKNSQNKEIYNAIKEKDSEKAIEALRVYLNYFDELVNK